MSFKAPTGMVAVFPRGWGGGGGGGKGWYQDTRVSAKRMRSEELMHPWTIVDTLYCVTEIC